MKNTDRVTMKRIGKIILFGIAICLSFSFVLAGCADPLEQFKRDKVLPDEWAAAFDAVYSSFEGMIGDNFKIEINAEKDLNYGEYREYSNCKLTAISCGETEYCNEKRVERKILSNGEVVSEKETVSERYLERTLGGTFEYVFENGEWIKKKSEAENGSIVFERVSSYNNLYNVLFTQSLPKYDMDKGGYYDSWIHTANNADSISCLYKLKDKKVVYVSAINRFNSVFVGSGDEKILFIYDYGKQKITLPQTMI